MGTSCSDSSRRCAVTITSSRTRTSDAGACADDGCACSAAPIAVASGNATRTETQRRPVTVAMMHPPFWQSMGIEPSPVIRPQAGRVTQNGSLHGGRFWLNRFILCAIGRDPPDALLWLPRESVVRCKSHATRRFEEWRSAPCDRPTRAWRARHWSSISGCRA
jgi:hypothetical protein